MRKGIIIFVSAAIMIFASVSLFGQYSRGGYGRGGYGRGDYCGYGRGYNRHYNSEGHRYNMHNNYGECYYYDNQAVK